MYFGGNFAPILTEITALDLPVLVASQMSWKAGLLHIGPNPIGKVDPAHFQWITGTGLAHGLPAAGMPNGIAAATR
jgi:hypothetical protein